MRTIPTVLTAAITALVAFGAGRALHGQEPPPEPEAPTTVTAQRYKLTIYDSAMDFVHAMGRTEVELYFPESGIVCNLASAPLSGIGMNAFYGDPRYDIDLDVRESLGDEAPPPKKPDELEEVEVPRELFERIKELADLTKKRQEMAGALRTKLAATDLFR